MTKTTVTLTVPYAGRDRSITGSPLSIARALIFIEMGLPTLDEQNTTVEISDKCDDAPSPVTMGMGFGGGQEFITGSYTLITAIRHVMDNVMDSGKANSLRHHIIAQIKG